MQTNNLKVKNFLLIVREEMLSEFDDLNLQINQDDLLLEVPANMLIYDMYFSLFISFLNLIGVVGGIFCVLVFAQRKMLQNIATKFNW